MKIGLLKNKFLLFAVLIFITMCAPPAPEISADAVEEARLDSIRQIRCPRVFSSAAEFYKNRDWENTVKVYGELTDLGCDRDDPKEVYLYYAIAFEYMGRYDSSEYVLLKGLTFLPNNIELRKRLAYSYQKQGKKDLQMDELDRLSYLSPEDVDIKSELSKLYEKEERYDDQILVLKDLLKIQPNNEGAQSDLAQAYERSGRDPLEVYKSRFESNPDNISYGLDYSDKLLEADSFKEAIDILRQVVTGDPTSKVAFRKLAQAYETADDLELAAKTYEKLSRLDPRNSRHAIKISEVYLENQNYSSAFEWADRAIMLSNDAESIVAKANVYYRAFNACRSDQISTDDRVVATLAYQAYGEAEKKGFSKNSRSKKWLSDNDVLFGKAEWFMMDANIKNRGYIKTTTPCYDWVGERLNKQSNW